MPGWKDPVQSEQQQPCAAGPTRGCRGCARLPHRLRSPHRADCTRGMVAVDSGEWESLCAIHASMFCDVPPAGSADGVKSRDVIHHVPGLDPVARYIRAHAYPCGVLSMKRAYIFHRPPGGFRTDYGARLPQGIDDLSPRHFFHPTSEKHAGLPQPVLNCDDAPPGGFLTHFGVRFPAV